jgi:hypothetical protein
MADKERKAKAKIDQPATKATSIRAQDKLGDHRSNYWEPLPSGEPLQRDLAGVRG